MPIDIEFASKFNFIEEPYEQALERRISSILETFKDAEHSIKSVQERMKIQQNKLQQAYKFKIRDIVLLYNASKQNVHRDKFSSQWNRPIEPFVFLQQNLTFYTIDQKLQQAFLKVYQMLQPKQAGVNIQFLENEIKITHLNEDSSSTIIKETILPVPRQKKGPKIQDYVEEIFEASFNFDLEYLNEENTDNLLQALLKPDISNRMKLFLYSKLGNKFTSILYQKIGGHPIIEFKKITPKWLYSLTNEEFEKFMNEY
ncbi:14239_t:CDS:2 [Cetraspora pellucida]|uniref:14239_t:CDS:1 n=1 Tax=Cetraspora pellucida TaxID=1433469 RepID=A0ACA9LGF3_9GLOM|nr:14239_t:CDS:2 [Cetraspora pellucida]